MFQSEPICIFTAGKTVDGREFGQEVVDEIAETYDPSIYNARINEDHWSRGDKFGSVLSVEKREDQLWAILKPNELFFKAIQSGQLLHTSCELQPDFAGSGKWYLTGLALTDSPASLGTTEIHLSAKDKDKIKGKVKLSTGEKINENADNLKNNRDQDEDESMNKETREMFEKQTKAITELANVVALLSDKKTGTKPVETIESLGSKLESLTERLSNFTDEEYRSPAGSCLDDGFL